MSEAPASLQVEYEEADTHCPFCQEEIESISLDKNYRLICQNCHKPIVPGESKESLQRYGAILAAKMEALCKEKGQKQKKTIEKALQKAQKAIFKSIKIKPALQDYLILRQINSISASFFNESDKEKAARALISRALNYEQIAALQPGSLSFLDASDHAYYAAEYIHSNRLKQSPEKLYLKSVDYARKALEAASKEEVDFLEEVLCYRLLDAALHYKEKDRQKAADLIRELLSYKENLIQKSLPNGFAMLLPQMINLLNEQGFEKEALSLAELCEQTALNEWRDHPDKEGLENYVDEITPLIDALLELGDSKAPSRLLQGLVRLYSLPEVIEIIQKHPDEHGNLGDSLETLLEGIQIKTALLDEVIEPFCQGALQLERLYQKYPDGMSTLHLSEICRYIATYYARKGDADQALLWSEKSLAPFIDELKENKLNTDFEEAAYFTGNLAEVLGFLEGAISKENKKDRKRLHYLIEQMKKIADKGEQERFFW